MTDHENRFLAACYDDPANIDKGVAAGLTPDHFTGYAQRNQWTLLCELRGSNQPTDTTAVYAAATTTGRLDKVGGLAGITECSSLVGIAALNGTAALSLLLAGHAQRTAARLPAHGRSLIEQPSVDLAEVGKVGEELVEACAGKVASHRPISVIAGEATDEAKAAIEGRKDDRVTIETGLRRL